MRLVVTFALLVCLVSAGCGRGDRKGEAPSEVVGVILFVDTAANGDVIAFKLESAGETYDVAIADDVDYGFDLGHLNEHVATGDPVRCRLERRNGRLYALAIEDAPRPDGS